MEIVLITGATGLIGRNLVHHFLGRGATVVAVARSKKRLEAVRGVAGSDCGRYVPLQADLEDAHFSDRLVSRLDQLGIWPDSLVNNARDTAHLSLESGGHPAREAWVGEFTVDIIAAYELTMALANQRASRLRCVVNVSSIYGMVAANPSLYDDPIQQSPIHYSVAKAGLIHLTKELAVRLAPRNIRVNCISFGGISGRADKTFESRYAELAPLRRMVDEAEVAEPIQFLLSDASGPITGQNIAADCGWTVW